MSKISKIILKDFVNGKLLFCKLPPGMELEGKVWQSNWFIKGENEKELKSQQEQNEKIYLEEK
jgi:hypothetical protein